MKIACYILSIYFMSLAGLACADAAPLEKAQNTVSTMNIDDSNHSHSQENGKDGCSPLCVCHCCHVHFVSVLGVTFTHPVRPALLYTSYLEDFRSIEIFGLLKPPRS